jgi:hypothetical protein
MSKADFGEINNTNPWIVSWFFLVSYYIIQYHKQLRW